MQETNSSEKKKPQRTCLGCRTAKNKNELIRVVRAPEGTVSIDSTGRKNGRGAYLCKDPACLKKALKSRSLQKALKSELPDAVAESLMKELMHDG